MGVSASAATMQDAVRQSLLQFHVKPFLKFVVGDTANYNMNVTYSGQNISGTMVMSVTAVDSTGVTIDQNANIAGQTQDIVEVIDPNTGAIISVTVNGQKQTPPDPNDIQVTGQSNDTITVPAGSFPCVDTKFHMVSENTDGEQWSDTDTVPVGGMVQMNQTAVQDGQSIPVQLQLTSYQNGSGS
jgi:hypothetical protein